MGIRKKIKALMEKDTCDICGKKASIKVMSGLLGTYCREHGMRCAAFVYTGNVMYLLMGDARGSKREGE